MKMGLLSSQQPPFSRTLRKKKKRKKYNEKLEKLNLEEEKNQNLLIMNITTHIVKRMNKKMNGLDKDTKK